jgi:predicted ATPase
MIFLRSISVASRDDSEATRFPFSVPAIRTLPKISLTSPVTFFVGENGSGKSTLLEAIAAAARLPSIGSLEVAQDSTLEHQRRLGKTLRLAWAKRAHRGFFLRAEDFFGFTKTLARMRNELQAELARIDTEYEGRSELAKGLARGPHFASLADMERRYGVDLDANSHGESFLRVFAERFVPDGLYLLDEPEAPLSPQSQLGLIAMLKDMVEQSAQFIIATHSPILLAFPGATILSFDERPVRAVAYGDLAHVNLTRDFLQDPERYLRRL